MNDRPTPETDAACWRSRLQGHETVDDCDPELCHADFARKLECERDEMREDLDFRISLYKVQESQLNDLRERLNEMQTFESTRNSQLREAIISTLEENRHLADGDDCTLAKLKSVVPDWK